MYTFVARVISWAMGVYNTTQGFLFVSCCWYKGCSISIDIHKQSCISFVPFILIWVFGRVKAAAKPQEWSNLGLDMGNFIT